MGSQELSKVEKEHESVNDTNLNTHGHTKVFARNVKYKIRCVFVLT